MKRAVLLILSVLIIFSGLAMVSCVFDSDSDNNFLDTKETDTPVTESYVSEPPATEPPVTEPPATEPPATEPPATEPPVESSTSRDYVVNKNTKKFHYPGCSSVKDIKDKNRWDFAGTRDELIKMEYIPCKRCNP